MNDFITIPGGFKLYAKPVGQLYYPGNLLNDINGADAMGVVGPSPNPYSLLGRLKAVGDGLGSGVNGTLTEDLVSIGISTQAYTIVSPGSFNFSVFSSDGFAGTWGILRDTGDGPVLCGDGDSQAVFSDTNFGSQVLYEPCAGTKYYIQLFTRNSGTFSYRFGNAP